MSFGENILELRHVSKTFPGVVALKNVDMMVRSGEVHALLGETARQIHAYKDLKRISPAR